MALTAGIEHPPTSRALDQALARAELRSWLLDWPGYLAALPATRLGRVLERIDAVADRLGIGGDG
jgi:hypothetical protein